MENLQEENGLLREYLADLEEETEQLKSEQTFSKHLTNMTSARTPCNQSSRNEYSNVDRRITRKTITLQPSMHSSESATVSH